MIPPGFTPTTFVYGEELPNQAATEWQLVLAIGVYKTKPDAALNQSIRNVKMGDMIGVKIENGRVAEACYADGRLM